VTVGECGRKTSENTKAAADSGEKLAGAAAAQVVWFPPFLPLLHGGRGGVIPACHLSLLVSLALAFRFCFLCSWFAPPYAVLCCALSAFHFGSR
jgi:hypothetical protein